MARYQDVDFTKVSGKNYFLMFLGNIYLKDSNQVAKTHDWKNGISWEKFCNGSSRVHLISILIKNGILPRISQRKSKIFEFQYNNNVTLLRSPQIKVEVPKAKCNLLYFLVDNLRQCGAGYGKCSILESDFILNENKIKVLGLNTKFMH